MESPVIITCLSPLLVAVMKSTASHTSLDVKVTLCAKCHNNYYKITRGCVRRSYGKNSKTVHDSFEQFKLLLVTLVPCVSEEELI